MDEILYRAVLDPGPSHGHPAEIELKTYVMQDYNVVNFRFNK